MEKNQAPYIIYLNSDSVRFQSFWAVHAIITILTENCFYIIYVFYVSMELKVAKDKISKEAYIAYIPSLQRKILQAYLFFVPEN